jgi:hypothetical protein
MRHAIAGAVTFAAVLTMSGTDAQQLREDGTAGPETARPVFAPRAVNTPRFVVPFVRTHTATAGQRSATAITVVNTAGVSCRVRVDFHAATKPGAAACRLTLVVGAGLSLDFCTRNIPGAITTCNAVCNPEQIGLEGKATIYTADTTACTKIRIDPRIYYFSGVTSDTGVLAVSNTQFAPF